MVIVEYIVICVVKCSDGRTTRRLGISNRSGGGGVDNPLAKMLRPEKLLAISKTSANWDLFKANNADRTLGEQLENKVRGDEAYLVKRDS